MARLAFIGLGNMGRPMAINLAKAGHQVCVFDLSAESMAGVVEHGGIGCDSAVEAAKNSEFVFTMLPAGVHVRSLLLTDDALFDKVAPKTLFIDCSSIDLDTTRQLAFAAVNKGVAFIDAPVSGGTAGAQAGTLSFMVGGAQADFERAKPLLDVMGANLFHAGAVGAGQTAKACNNMMLAILMAGSAEVLNLGINNGLDPRVLADIMLKSSGTNWVLDKYNPVPGVMENTPASNGYQGGFMVDLMCKDLGLAMAASQSSQSPVPMGSAAKGLFNLHQSKGKGALDFSSVIELFTTTG